jgi:hypothetical protein
MFETDNDVETEVKLWLKELGTIDLAGQEIQTRRTV